MFGRRKVLPGAVSIDSVRGVLGSRVCAHVCARVYMCVCLCVRLRLCLRVRFYLCARVSVCTRVCVCVCMCVCVRVCVRAPQAPHRGCDLAVREVSSSRRSAGVVFLEMSFSFANHIFASRTQKWAHRGKWQKSERRGVN
jgi:hypothetical protein